MRVVEPDQHYCPIEDLHITVFDFLKARLGYAPDPDFEARIVRICEEACSGLVLGLERVSRLELVEHDWHNSAASRRLIEGFSPGSLFGRIAGQEEAACEDL